MTTVLRAALVAAFAIGGFARAADLASVDRTIKKEPAYQTKSPRYALLVFGPEARDRVWLVHDGDTLYVDRNGDGDLTDAGEKVAAKVGKDRNLDENGYEFRVGDLPIGGRLHKRLTVYASSLSRYPDTVRSLPNAKTALAADAKAHGYTVKIELDMPGMKGMGVGGRVMRMAGVIDGAGALLFADKPAAAPVIHLDGPLQVTFYGEKPKLMLERDNDVVLVVGTPGVGPGTLAMLYYEDTIPTAAFPQLEIEFAAQKPGTSPVHQTFELRHRC
jgi:hypothetical protein